MECLLASLWTLTCASLADSAEDAEVASGVGRFLEVWGQFHAHAGSRFRLLALSALHRHVIVAADLSLPAPTVALMQRALLALLNQIAPTLAVSVPVDMRILRKSLRADGRSRQGVSILLLAWRLNIF